MEHMSHAASAVGPPAERGPPGQPPRDTAMARHLDEKGREIRDSIMEEIVPWQCHIPTSIKIKGLNRCGIGSSFTILRRAWEAVCAASRRSYLAESQRRRHLASRQYPAAVSSDDTADYENQPSADTEGRSCANRLANIDSIANGALPIIRQSERC
ncbi:unnamed protein product, partial [Iphiclides podalirius]